MAPTAGSFRLRASTAEKTLDRRRLAALWVPAFAGTAKKILLLPERLAVADELLAGQMDAFAVVGDDAADHLGAPAVALQNGQYRVAIRLGGEHAKPDPHIVDLMHLRIADVPQSPDHLKYRRRRRQAVDQEPDFGVHTRQVQKPVAGDVDQGLYRRNVLNNVEDLRYID